MLNRCKDPNNRDYGSKGTSVCARWKKFENFLADMGERPAGTSIERINNKIGYKPSNCRWATDREQNWNKGDTVLVSFGGEAVPLKEAARRAGVKYQKLHFWVRKKGLALDLAIERSKKHGRWAT